MGTASRAGPVAPLLLAMCAAGGAGLLLATFTVSPPRPPQPSSLVPVSAAVPAAVPEDQGAAGPLPRSEPVSMRIPAIGVRADIVPVGIDQAGELEVPALEQAMQVGWWRQGVTPGERGSAALVGHVDSYRIGPAVFFQLGKLQPGDEITVQRTDGTSASFAVNTVRSYVKTEFPTQTVYGMTEAAELRLITCGGEYDKKARSYLSNVVVFATLRS